MTPIYCETLICLRLNKKMEADPPNNPQCCSQKLRSGGLKSWNTEQDVDGNWEMLKANLAIAVTHANAIADKPRDAFRGQLTSPNMVLFDMLGMVSYVL